MSEIPPSSAPPAGWYPDPIEPSVVRWWDGTQWTHHLQPAPQSEPETTKPPWLTNRVAIGAVLGLVAVLTVLFLVLGGSDDGGETSSTENLSSTEIVGLDAEAKAQALTAQTAIETYSTDNDGAYEGATPEALTQIEPTVPSDIEIQAGADSYVVTAPSETGTRFSLARSPDGTVTYPCDAPGEGGCPDTGDWAGQ